MQPRWYQSEAEQAVWSHLTTRPGNPVVVLPTGAGKSLVIAMLARTAVERYRGRVMVVQHRKELIGQNADKVRLLLPGLDVGVYSAGLSSRDTDHAVVLCGIQSVYNKAHDFGERHLVLIDEAHLCPLEGEGMYRTFLSDLRSANPRLRCVGLTATPYRLDCGPLCRPDGLFQKVAYSADVHRMIAEGYLCKLTTRTAFGQIDTDGLKVRGGEFVQEDVAARLSGTSKIEASVSEIVHDCIGRKSVLVFCSGVNHAALVAAELERRAFCRVGTVTGETMPLEREATLSAFRSGELRFLTNCDVLTTGFDAPNIDAICLLRATLSPGLYAQMVGRGFRVCPGKRDCLVLDFGRNIERHGPIDAIDFGRCKRTGEKPGEAPTKTCPNCEAEIHAATAECECGFVFPKPELKHDEKADTGRPIISEPETWLVERINYSLHVKKKATPDDCPTMRVDYTCRPSGGNGGNMEEKVISEWVCVEHPPGFARRKAKEWWRARSRAPVPETVDEAVDLARRGAVASVRSIVCVREGRWYRVLRADMDDVPETWAESAGEESVGWEEELAF